MMKGMMKKKKKKRGIERKGRRRGREREKNIIIKRNEGRILLDIEPNIIVCIFQGSS